MEVMSRARRHQLGAEELLELGRPVPMYRYAHTPFLAGRRDLGSSHVPVSVPVVVNLFRPERNLLTPLGETAPQALVRAETSPMTKALIIGIPVAFVLGVFALT